MKKVLTLREKKAKLKRGWHSNSDACPHKGKNITVDPLRSKGDINRIKRGLKSHPRDYALFVVGINIGLRGTDLLRLKFKDVLDEDGEVKPEISIRERKNKKIRVVALSQRPRKALQALCNGSDVEMDSFVFASRKGGRLKIQRLHQLVNVWCHTAKVRGHFGSHTLRKTFSYHLLRQGNRIDLVMQILGHSSPAITLRYAGITKEETDRAVLKMNL